MSKNLIFSAVFALGLFFIVTGSDKKAVECSLSETQECWQYDSQKGWIYQAPEINVTPAISTESWSFDAEKGWIYQADEITVTG